jgi:hypothetical protein
LFDIFKRKVTIQVLNKVLADFYAQWHDLLTIIKECKARKEKIACVRCGENLCVLRGS